MSHKVNTKPNTARTLVACIVVLLITIGGIIIVMNVDWDKALNDFSVSLVNSKYLDYCNRNCSESEVREFIDLFISTNTSPKHLMKLEGITNKADLSSSGYRYIYEYRIECTEYFEDGKCKTFKISPVENPLNDIMSK